jgi:uncharacterized membrane-anchored protein
METSADSVLRINMADTFYALFIAWLVYVVLIIFIIVIPAALNLSLGARHFYTRFLVKIIKVCLIWCVNFKVEISSQLEVN